LYIVDHLPPGATISRRIEVTNTTAGPAHVLVYASGAAIESGVFTGAAAHSPNELSSWAAVSPAAADVAAAGRATATVTIRVPRDAAPGERYAVVWAEARSPADARGVVQVNRVGIRLYLSVGPGGPPPADFAIESLTAKRAADGTPSVTATVHNTGGRALDISGTLHLAGGPGGLRAGPFGVTVGSTLAIGATQPIAVALDKRLPDGPWEAQIVLRSGLVERTARATITFPVSGAAPAEPVRPTSREHQLYAVIAGLLLLGLALPIALVLRRSYRLRLAQLA
jgi:hypothetical protein